MAIAITTPGVKHGFIANATSANISGTETLVAGVSGKRIKVAHLSIQSDDAIGITILDSTPTALIGELQFAALGFHQWYFNPYMELPVGLSLQCDADGAGVVWIFVQGFIE